jgi:hypothetical protein
MIFFDWLHPRVGLNELRIEFVCFRQIALTFGKVPDLARIG